MERGLTGTGGEAGADARSSSEVGYSPTTFDAPGCELTRAMVTRVDVASVRSSGDNDEAGAGSGSSSKIVEAGSTPDDVPGRRLSSVGLTRVEVTPSRWGSYVTRCSASK